MKSNPYDYAGWFGDLAARVEAFSWKLKLAALAAYVGVWITIYLLQ